MENIKLQILKLLSENNKKMWGKIISPCQQEYLDSIYSGYQTFIQCKLLFENKERPSCVICNGPLKLLRNETCSTKCREINMKNNGHDRMAIIKEKMIEKYGISNIMQNSDFTTKAINTKIEKYGEAISPKQRENLEKNAIILNQKGKETILAKYGVSNPSQIKGHYEKTKATLMERHGVDHPSKLPDIIENNRQRRINNLKDILPNTISFIGLHIAPDFLIKKYDNPNDRIKFHCSIHDNEEELATETFKYRIRTFGNPCSKCSHISTSYSHKEKEIFNFIKDNTNLEILENDRKLIYPYELDIVVPEKKLAIEFCGLYWHSDRRKNKKYHYEKLQKCKNIGYNLITIFEDEWDHKSDIVKTRILYKLGMCDKTIWARKCKIKEVPNDMAMEFNNKYHIQGHINSSIKYGLFFNEELVALMMFAKSNISKGKGTGMELTRFTTSCNVVGAAGKLFKHFLKTNNPETVFSYSDLRWNTGNVYKQIGMTFVGETRINYWYVLGNKRIHRFGLRKSINENKNMSEFELRDSEGWLRIWDCGNEKYIWNKE
jgi:hypothetical protein